MNCPRCGTKGAYQGFSHRSDEAECLSRTCPNFSQRHFDAENGKAPLDYPPSGLYGAGKDKAAGFPTAFPNLNPPVFPTPKPSDRGVHVIVGPGAGVNSNALDILRYVLGAFGHVVPQPLQYQVLARTLSYAKDTAHIVVCRYDNSLLGEITNLKGDWCHGKWHAGASFPSEHDLGNAVNMLCDKMIRDYNDSRIARLKFLGITP